MGRVREPGFRASRAGMIKHYDRFIGGHDSAINHLATSNTRGGGGRVLTTMSQPRRVGSRLVEKNQQMMPISVRYSVSSEGKRVFSRCGLRSVCRTGQVIAAGTGREDEAATRQFWA